MGGREGKAKLDLRGLVCPFTLIVLQREVKRLEGTTSLVEVLVTDPSACESIPAWAVDPTEEPGDYRQVAGALSNALNDLFVLAIHKNLKIAPVVNAPMPELVEKVIKGVKRYAKMLNAEVLELPLPERGRLLLGVTVMGESDKHPPTFYDKVAEGMKVLVTRPLGELAPISVYLATLLDETVLCELEEMGISFRKLRRLKEEAVSIIAEPNIRTAKVISKYLPEERFEFDPSEHVVATTDVTGSGVYVLKELASRLRAVLRIHSVPLLFPEVSAFAASKYILPNATAGTNGSFVIVASEPVVDCLVRELRRVGQRPTIVGEVVGRGRGEAQGPRDLSKYVTDESVLYELGVA